VDTIGDPPIPISYMFDGFSYAALFSLGLEWQDQYLNESSNWVTFGYLQTETEYRGTDMKARQIYLGVTGAWQGP
jgi:hypothetical protein